MVGRTDFSRIFIFGPPNFFRGFSRRIFSPHFFGKKCPEKSSRKIPGKTLQNLYNKNPPTHFCRLAGARLHQTILVNCVILDGPMGFHRHFYLIVPSRPILAKPLSWTLGVQILLPKKSLARLVDWGGGSLDFCITVSTAL